MGTARFVAIEVEAGEGLDEGVSLRFRAISPSRAVTRLVLVGEEQAGVFTVSAWNDAEEGAPLPAMATEVEDSSEGVALLLHGGALGIRLVDECGVVTREACLLLASTTDAS